MHTPVHRLHPSNQVLTNVKIATEAFTKSLYAAVDTDLGSKDFAAADANRMAFGKWTKRLTENLVAEFTAKYTEIKTAEEISRKRLRLIGADVDERIELMQGPERDRLLEANYAAAKADL